MISIIYLILFLPSVLLGAFIGSYLGELLFNLDNSLKEWLEHRKFMKGYEEREIIKDGYVLDGRWQAESKHAARCVFKVTEFRNTTNFKDWVFKKREIISQGEWRPVAIFETEGLERYFI